MRFYFGILLVNLAYAVHAQPPSEAFTDSVLADGIKYCNTQDYVKAQAHFEQLIEQYKATNHDDLLQRAYSWKGVSLYLQAKYRKAITAYERTHFLIKKSFPDRVYQRANVSKNLGMSYRKLALYDSALSHFFESVRVLKPNQHTIKEQSLLGDCYNLIGNVYRQLYQNNKALQFQQACLAIRFAIQDSVGIAMTYHNIAMAHSNLDSLTPALNYAQKSLHWKAQLGKSTASTLRLMGAIHFQQFQYDSAIYFYQKALELRKTNHKRAIIYNSLAEVYLMKGERRKTQQALDSVQLLLATKEHPETELAYFMNKGKFALISGNTKDGQAAFIAYQKLRSKLYNRQVSKIAQAETKYYTAFLSAKAEHQQKENQLLAERTRIQTVLLMALGILFIVSIFALINYRRLLQAKKKAHAQVQEFNEELSAKNEEIHTQNKQLSEQKKYIENIKASLEHDLGNDLLRLREIALFPIQTTNTIHEVNAFEKLQNSLLAIVNLYSLLLDEHSTKENTQSILEDLCETMAAKYGQKEVVIKINARIAFSGTAKDRLQFRMLLEVITELLQNMFKYAFESESLNPQATIQVKRVEKGIEVNYTDNGVGFPSELVHLGSKGLLILEEVAKDQQLEFGNQNQGGAFVNLIIKEI